MRPVSNYILVQHDFFKFVVQPKYPRVMQWHYEAHKFALDDYIFIQDHLKDCPFCRQEVEEYLDNYWQMIS